MRKLGVEWIPKRSLQLGSLTELDEPLIIAAETVGEANRKKPVEYSGQ